MCNLSKCGRSLARRMTWLTARILSWSTARAGPGLVANLVCRCEQSSKGTSMTKRFTFRCSGENRGRSNLSAWEQGVSYLRALKEGLFPSARRLAEQIGLDHSNVAKALRVAELPQEIIGAFRSPIEIQFRWAVALDKAYQHDAHGVLLAARTLAGQSPRPAASEVFRGLTEPMAAKSKPKAKEMVRAFALADGKKGVIRVGKGGAVVVELPRGVLPPAHLGSFELALSKLLSDLPQAL